VGFMLGNRVLFRKAFEVLEPCASRDARTVLRGGSGGNAASLPDAALYRGAIWLCEAL
jgi:hypothetical protein